MISLTWILYLIFPLEAFSTPQYAEQIGGVCCSISYTGQESIELNGNYRFYWEKLYSHDSTIIIQPPDSIIYVPTTWNGLKIKGQELGAFGHATYAVRIDADQSYEDAGFSLAGFYSAYRLYLNGDLVAKNGLVGTTPETSTLEWLPQTVPVRLQAGSNELVLEVSNYQHSKGGFFVGITLGSIDYLEKVRDQRTMIEMFIVGAILIIAFFYIGLYFFWRKSYEILFYIIFASSYAVRILTNGLHLFNVIFPDIPWQFALKIEYAAMYITWGSSWLIFYKVFPRILTRVVIGLFGSYILIVLFTPAHIYTGMLYLSMLSGGIVFITGIVIVLIAFRSMSRKFTISLVFIVSIFTSWLFGYLIYYGYVPYLTFVPTLMLLTAVLTLAFLASENYTSAYQQVEKLQIQTQSQKEIIEQQYHQIERISNVQKMWFRSIAHELRTPITLIHGPLEHLEKHPKSNTKKLLGIARKNAYRLFYLVDQVLDLVRSQDGAFKLRPTWISVDRLVRKSMEFFEVEGELKDVRISIENQVGHAEVYADFGRMDQVIFNLLSNALKFTPEKGEVIVQIVLDPEKNLCVKIQDTGAGIPQEDQGQVFDLYFTRNEDPSKSGGGIGLYMCRVIMEEHNGKIFLESTPGVGTCLTLFFPRDSVRRMAESEHKEVAIQAKEVVLNQLRILVAEDEPGTRFYLHELLKGAALVKQVENGHAALQELQSGGYDLLITDISMPEMDGVTLLKVAKQQNLIPPYGSIMLTAYRLEDEILDLFIPGVNEYIQKPFLSDTLMNSIYYLSEHARERHGIIKGSGSSEQQNELLDPLLKSIRKNLSDPDLKVAAIAHELGLSERNLFRLTKEVTGMTPALLLKNMRLDEARRLVMDQPEMKIGEIARAVGYSSHSYFTRSYQERFGCMPSQSV